MSNDEVQQANPVWTEGSGQVGQTRAMGLGKGAWVPVGKCHMLASAGAWTPSY